MEDAAITLAYALPFGYGSLVVAWFLAVLVVKRSRRYDKRRGNVGVALQLFAIFLLVLFTYSTYLSLSRTSTLILLTPRKIIEGPDLEIFLKHPSHVRPGGTLEITLTMLNFNEYYGGEIDVKLEDFKKISKQVGR